MRTHNLLSRVVRKSLHSPCRHKVVAVGLNHRGTIINMRCNTPRFYSIGGGYHAEELVIHSSPRSLHRILIARVNKRGKLLPIDPCERCTRLAAKYGIVIKRLEYHRVV